MDESPDPRHPSSEPRWQVVLVFIFMLVGLQLVAGPRLRLSEWTTSPLVGGRDLVGSSAADEAIFGQGPGLAENHGMLEARAWRKGRLDLSPTGPDPRLGLNRPRDTAYHDGKVYNVFPPLFTLLSRVALWLQDLQGLVGRDATVFYAPWYVALVALPLPIVGFWAFRTASGRSAPAAVFTAYLILGTPLLAMLANCRVGSINEINHALCCTGLLLVIGDLLGKRRMWPTALGLLIAMGSRQLTAFYIPATLWVVWRLTAHRPRNLVFVGTAAVIGLGTLATLDYLKFGSVFETGYQAIYVGREDMYARRATAYGRPFDPRFVPINLWHMTVSPPVVEQAGMGLRVTGHPDGTAIWMTSPLLLLALWDIRRWWRAPAPRALMLCSLAVIAGLLCYHTTGSVQRGFYRFALDFAPIWLAVVATGGFAGRRRWVILAMLAYSAFYFHLLA